MKKLFLSFVMMLTATAAAWAQYAVIDGVRYYISDSSYDLSTEGYPSGYAAIVKVPEEGVYSGEVTIPSFVTYEDEQYPVAMIDQYSFKNATVTKVAIPATVRYIENGAFNNASNLTAIDLPEGVESIGMSAFDGCPLTSVTIPGSVKIIRSNAFPTSLTSLTFAPGESTLTLERYAFGHNSDTGITYININRNYDYSWDTELSSKLQHIAIGPNVSSNSDIDKFHLESCSELTKIELLEGWKEIPYNMFKDLTNFTTLTLPVGLEIIGQEAFSGCTGLTAVTLPEGLKTIYSEAFTGSGITSVTVPGTVRSITSAFRGCEHLTSLTLAYTDDLTDDGWLYGKGVLVSDGGAFEGSPITDVTIDRAWHPNVWDSKAPIPTAKRVTFGPHATNIPEWMFGELAIESVTIGENVTQVEDYAFQKCQLPEGATIPFAQFKKIGSNAFEECVGIPATLNLSAVEEIGSYAFRNCTSIESLIIGGGTIEYYAFDGCSNLSSLTLLEGVTKIGQSNFQYLTNLTTVNMPSTLKEIGADAFAYCENMTIPSDLPEGLEIIGARAFYQCKKLNVNIPSTVTTIDQGAFSYCESLEKIVIPAGVKYLNMSTFSDCKNITTVTIPGTLLSMSSYDFGDCENLKEVIFEQGTEPFKINSDYAFSGTPVTKLYIDRVVEGISRGYLFNSGIDIEVEFGPNCTAVGDYLLSGLTNMKSITMSDNVKSIGNSSIYWAKAETLKVSKKLETIGDFAFMAYTFTEGSFTIPFTVKEIGEAAFGQFRSWGNTLKNVYVPWLTPLDIEDNEPEEDNHGSNTRFAYADNQTLWVPGGTMELYKAAPIWKKFKNFDYWSFVATAKVAGKGTLTVANGEEVTDNGTNTEKSIKGENLVEAGAGEAVSGLFVREKDLVLAGKPARGYELKSVTANGVELTVTKDTAIVSNLLADQNVAATFIPIIYKLTYNLAGGVLPEGKQNPATYTVEDDAITLVNPERDGYTFEGWKGTDIEGISMEVTIPANSIGNREFTATWKPIVYDITYELNGGTVPDGSTVGTYTIETPDFTLINPTKLGYTFLGWTGTDLTEATITVTITTGHVGNRSYTATWEPNPYQVAFDANNGTGEMANQNFVYDVAQNLTQNAFTRPGYTFDGWNSKADGTGTPYTDLQEVLNLTAERDKVVTMYAQWKPITYAITYNLNGGEVATENPETYNADTPDFTLVNPTREGYTFLGWTGTDLLDVTQTVTIVKGSIGDRTYTANWQINEYKVIIAATENGTVEASTLTPLHGEDVVLTITPVQDYLLESLTVNGEDVTEQVVEGKYTIVSVKGDVTVTATFMEDPLVGIASVQGTSSMRKPVFDLNGNKVADEFNPKSLHRGVYIVEGRKVVIK